MSNTEQPSMSARFWHEIEPIVNHALVVLVLEITLLLIGGLTLLLGRLFPTKEAMLFLIEDVDIWTALIVLCLFAAYTLAQVAIRLYRSLAIEWRRGARALEDAATND